MSKYYKEEDVIRAFKEWLAISEAAEDIIADLPTIEVVRCKECKYAHMTYDGECKYCDKWSLEDSLHLDGDFFCSYGVRKGTDDED